MKPAQSLAVVVLSVLVLVAACNSPTEPVTPLDCSKLDYWTVDGRGGCYRMIHEWNEIAEECDGSVVVIECP